MTNQSFITRYFLSGNSVLTNFQYLIQLCRGLCLSQYFAENPDSKNPAYNTKYGVYLPGCGLENVFMSWGHDDYMYLVQSMIKTFEMKHFEFGLKNREVYNYGDIFRWPRRIKQLYHQRLFLSLDSILSMVNRQIENLKLST